MNASKNRTQIYPSILMSIGSALGGLLITSAFGVIIDPLFDNMTKALLAGFTILAIILIITGLILTIFIRSNKQQLDKFEINLLAIKNDVKNSNSLAKVGISGAYTKHTNERLEKFYSKAHHEIRILQTYFGSGHTLPYVFDAAKRGVGVKILLLDPNDNNQMILQRLLDIGMPSSVQVHKDSLIRLKALMDNNLSTNDLFEVRVYTNIPPFAMYKSDNRIMLGFFWQGKHYNAGPSISIEDENSLFGRSAIETFDKIWETSKPAFSRPSQKTT